MFSFSFEIPIWRMLAEVTGQWMALELRDTETHELQFRLLDLKTERLFEQQIDIEDAWWAGIVDLKGDYLVLHKFQDSDNPEKKTFFVVDIFTHKISWLPENFIFSGITQNAIYGYEKAGESLQTYKEISLSKGTEKALNQREYEQKVNKLTKEEGENKDITYPFYYPEDHAYFATVKAFLIRFLQIHAVKGCEYLEHRQAIIISYYIYEGKALANYLLVMNTSQEVVLHERIDAQLEGVGADTFFVVKNKVIYIKDKHQLIGYALENV